MKFVKSTIVFLITLLICNIICVPISSPILEIRYVDEEVRDSANLFYPDVKKTYNGKNVISSPIKGGLSIFDVGYTLLFVNAIRIDPIESETNIGINEINIYVDGKLYRSIEGKDLYENILATENIVKCYVEDDSIIIEPENDDPIIYMNKNFIRLVKSSYHFNYGIYNVYVTLLIAVIYIAYIRRKYLCEFIKGLPAKTYLAYKNDTGYVFGIFVITLMTITFIVFGRFLTGKNVYIFSGIASDSLLQTYPSLISLAQKISQGIFTESWNGTNSLGGIDTFIYPTLFNWVSYFGVNNVAYLLGWSQFVKVLFAGFLFYGYLRTIGISKQVSSLFGIAYAYSGHSILRCAWIAYPNEVVLFALWLFCFERFFVKNDKKWLPIATALFFLNFSGYYSILYIGIFIVYGMLRYGSEYDPIMGLRKRVLNYIGFVFNVVIGFLISGVSSAASLVSMLNSNRFSNNIEISRFNFSNSITSIKTLKSAFLSAIGTNVLGIATKDFVGTANVLEGPTFYCGIFTLILIPIFLKCVCLRRKIWYGIGCVAAFAYIVIEPLRYTANGFASSTFKLSSFWIIVLFLLMAAQGLEYLKVHEGKVSKGWFIVPVVYIIGMIVCYIDGINIYAYIVSCVLICIYSVLLVLLNRKIGFSILSIILLCMFSCEVMGMTYPAISDLGIVDSKMFHGRTLYNDYTIEAIDILEEKDQTFFRVDKDYYSVFLCDSLYQGYNGTKGYVGGTGDNDFTGAFYVSTGFPIYNDNHYALGFEQSTQINTLLNVKYIISKNLEVSNYGYECIAQTGDAYIFENRNALPVGSGYKEYILREDFEKLSISQKRYVLMHACVIESKEDASSLSEFSSNEYGDDLTIVENFDAYEEEFQVEMDNDQYSIIFPSTASTDVAVLRLELDNRDSVYSVGGSYSGEKIYFYDEVGMHGIDSSFVRGKNEYIYEFSTDGVYQISFYITDNMSINDMHLYVIPKGIYYKDYESAVEELGQCVVEAPQYFTNKFVGRYYNSEQAKMLFFAIPYDENWHVYIDETEQDIYPVNIGFMGVMLQNGEHTVELRYENHDKYYLLTLAGLVLYILYLIYIHLEKKKSALVKMEDT